MGDSWGPGRNSRKARHAKLVGHNPWIIHVWTSQDSLRLVIRKQNQKENYVMNGRVLPLYTSTFFRGKEPVFDTFFLVPLALIK